MQKKYIIYARVSTVGQEDGTSLDTQIAQCTQLINNIDGSVSSIYKEAISGGLYLSRMQLQQAITDIESGEADGIVMFDMERFARHAAYQEIAVERIEKAGGEIHFCRDNYDNTPEGKLVRGIRGQVNQYFREKQRVLSRQGHLSRAESGIMPNRSVAPYGYYITKHADVKAGTAAKAGQYIIRKEQAEWVEFMYRQILSKKTIIEIAEMLNYLAVPTARGAKKWSSGVVFAILKNPVHKGAALFGEYYSAVDDNRIREGKNPYYRIKSEVSDCVIINAPAIVSPEIWEECQAIMHRRGCAFRQMLARLK